MQTLLADLHAAAMSVPPVHAPAVPVPTIDLSDFADAAAREEMAAALEAALSTSGICFVTG